MFTATVLRICRSDLGRSRGMVENIDSGAAGRRLGVTSSRWSRLTRVAAVSILSSAVLASTFGGGAAADRCRPGVNCILNPSLTDGPAEAPEHWRFSVFGNNDAAFKTTEGRTDSAAVNITVTSASGNQDAKWVFEDVPVVGGEYYVFSDWYKSTVPTRIYVYFTGGNVPYARLMDVPASETPDTWTHVTAPGFFVPAGATRMTVTHNIIGAGSLSTDDHSLVLETPPTFRKGLVSLAFDDGWKSVFENAIPILNEAGIKSTQYINTDPVVLNPENHGRNMSLDDLLAMQGEGHEIGAYTRLHLNLVEDINGEAARRGEIAGSRDDLRAAGIESVDTFAYPYGGYNDEIRAIVKESFLGARSMESGFNTTNTDRYALKSQSISNATKIDDIKQWIDYTIANHFWLILTFHQVVQSKDECVPESGPGDTTCTDVATLRAVVDYLKSLPSDATATVQEVLSDADLWTPPQPETPELTADQADTGETPIDPPSSYVGERITIEHAMNIAYAAGFRTEEQLTTAVGVAIGESDLWTEARNWHPELGFRDKSEQIGVEGPKAAWSDDGRQMHSDRGLFQISTEWWPQYSDEIADDPIQAAVAFYAISKEGTDFSIWDSVRSGRAQSHFDEPSKGYPALRPLARDFLNRISQGQTLISVIPADPSSAVYHPQVADEAQSAGATEEPPPAVEPAAQSPAADSGAKADAPATALAQLRQAADGGNAWAKIGLAEMLLQSKDPQADVAGALTLLTEAAAAGLEGPARGILGAYYLAVGDLERAIAALESAAAAGDDRAKLRLAKALIDGSGALRDPKRAITLLEEVAQTGLKGPAFKELGLYYLSVGDHAKAIAALEQAVEAGEPEAKVALADMLVKGWGTAPDPRRAVALLEEASQAGLKGPTYKGIADYYRGIGDNEHALAVLDEASQAGEVGAKIVLADMLFNGASPDPERAITLLNQAVTAGAVGPAQALLGNYYLSIGHYRKAMWALEWAVGAGESAAKFGLGKMLIEGAGGATPDPQRAIALLQEAAQDGMKGPAFRELGQYYRSVGDDGKAIAMLQQAVDAGDPEAELALAEMLMKGEGTQPAPHRAVALLERAAAAGLSGPAFKMLGDYYLSVGQPEQAVAALERASAADNAEAKLVLADLLVKGQGTPADPGRAMALLQQAAAAGLNGPTFKTIAEYYRGIGDHERALAVLERASEAGELEAKSMLADMLIKGEGTAVDPQRALALLDQVRTAGLTAPTAMEVAEYYRSSNDTEHLLAVLEQASDAGVAEAKLPLANMLMKGEGAAADPQRALALLERAADAGLAGPSTAAIADYYRGIGDSENALAVLEKGSEAGLAEAKVGLADMLVKGEGTEKQPERALALLQQVAKSGLAISTVRNIADYYRSSGDTEQLKVVLSWAAESGDADAKLELAGMLLDPQHAGHDPERAVELLKQAADAGLQGPAFKALGDYYLGAGDHASAADAFEQASAAGEPEARLKLAEMLIAGDGIKADLQRGIDLLQQSAETDLSGPALRILSQHYLDSGDIEKTRAVLEQAVKAGDTWAKVALAGLVIEHETKGVDSAKARELLEAALKQGEVSHAYVGLVELAASDYRNGGALAGAISLLRDARTVDASIALTSFEKLQPNDKTAVVQAILREEGLYSGPTDGRLTRRTLSAIAKFCSKKDIADCKSEVLPVALLHALLTVL